MDDPTLAKLRSDHLADVGGEVLKIGLGTGLNLLGDHEHVRRITTLDPNPGMNTPARRRITVSAIEVDQRRRGERSLSEGATRPSPRIVGARKSCYDTIGHEMTHDGTTADPSRWGTPNVISEEAREAPVFACCSVGIGRWFWVAWESEAEARALAPALATGYEASADRAEEKAAERLGPRLKRLPARWASGYKRRGGIAARAPGAGRDAGGSGTNPQARFGRPGGPPRRHDVTTRLAFLYCAAGREAPDSLGHVEVTRHRIVKQNARKIHVECDPFDEDEWARRAEQGGEAPEGFPKVRTLAVDRVALRAEGRFRCGRARHGPTFYASEEDGIRDVEAALIAKYPWCDRLGVRFPCSAASIKTAYRRLALTTHPDAGGEAAEFRAVEQAYRAALAYFARRDDAID